MELYPLSEQEHATILAALRCYQSQYVLGKPAVGGLRWLRAIATNGHTIPALTSDEIDVFLNRLNSDPRYVINGPTGLPIDPVPYKTIDEAVVAAARFVLPFTPYGWFSSAGVSVSLREAAAMLSLEVLDLEDAVDDYPCGRKDMDVDGWVTGIVEIKFDELVDNNSAGVRCILSVRLTGSERLMSVAYRVIGNKGDTLQVEVTGDATAIWLEGRTK